LLWEADEPDHGEDIDGFVEQKIAALLAHESQFESTMKAIDQTALDNFSERMRQRMIVLGQRIDRPAAEIFKKISDI
jgi:LmbE family N-acetylglucosaminyl deacetylase